MRDSTSCDHLINYAMHNQFPISQLYLLRLPVTVSVCVLVPQVAMRCGVPATQVKNMIIWGNHSFTQYPDVHHCKVNVSGNEVDCFDAVKDEAWLKGDFIAVSKPL